MRQYFSFVIAAALGAFAFLSSPLFAEEFAPAPKDAPGVVIDKSADFASIYIGSPSIEILPDGTYVASHDFFGTSPDVDRSTQVFESKDKGATWTQIGRIPRQMASYLFYLKDALYAIGWVPGEGFQDPDKDSQCSVVISRSTDAGRTWTTSPLYGGKPELSVFCDPAPVLVYNGRVWKEIEQMGDFCPTNSSGRFYLTQFRPMCASAPVDSDLLDASNWTFSNAIQWKMHDHWGGWAEGNVLFTPEKKMIIQMRVDDADVDGKGAQIQLSDDGSKATWDPATGFVEMPGGAKKFVIKYDEKTGKYWSLVNWIHPSDVDAPDKERTRNTLALVCSEDLKKWEIRTIVMRRDDLKIGFQYCDWRVEGDDMVFVCRLAWDGAHNCHDANYFTFHRLKNFRELTRNDDAPTWR